MRLQLLLLLPLVACSDRAATERRDPADPQRVLRQADDDPVAARVDATVIRRSVLESRVQSQVEQFRLAGRTITEAFRHQTRRTILEHLIERQLIVDEAKRRKISVPAEALDHHVEMFKERLGNDERFRGYLDRIGRGEQGWTEDQQLLLLKRRLMEVALEPQPVSDEAIKARYARQSQRYSRARRLRLAELLIRIPTAAQQPDKAARDRATASAKKRIEALRSQARKPGARFGTLVRKASESSSASRGGDLGWRRESQLPAPWAAELTGAKKGAVAGPFVGPDGLRLLQVVAVEEAKVLGLDEVREELKRELEAQALAKAERDLIASLRAAAAVVIEDHRLKPPVAADGEAKP